MPKQRETDRWIQAIRRWEVGLDGPEGEQLAFPGMPVPPVELITRALPYVLVTYADSDGKCIRPGKRQLARILCVGERYIRRCMIDLEKHYGLIGRCGNTRGGRGHTQEYVLRFPKWLPAKGVLQTPLCVPKGGTGDALKGVLQTPPSVKDDQPASAAVGSNGERPDQNEPTTPHGMLIAAGWSLKDVEAMTIGEALTALAANTVMAGDIGRRP